jgi:hypothetical protein
MIDPTKDDCGPIRMDREPMKRAGRIHFLLTLRVVKLAVAAGAEKAWEKQPATS